MKHEPLFYPSLFQVIPPNQNFHYWFVRFLFLFKEGPVTFCFFPTSPPLVAWTLFNLAVHVENDLNLPAFYGFSGHFLFPFFSLPLTKKNNKARILLKCILNFEINTWTNIFMCRNYIIWSPSNNGGFLECIMVPFQDIWRTAECGTLGWQYVPCPADWALIVYRNLPICCPWYSRLLCTLCSNTFGVDRPTHVGTGWLVYSLRR